MKFDFTSEEVWTLAEALARHYKRAKYRVYIECPVSLGAPRRTTLIAEKNGTKSLIECQQSVNYEAIRPLAQWIAANRLNCELFIATYDEAHISGSALTALRKEGVGLIILENESIAFPVESRNFALIVNIDPALRLGRLQPLVNKIVSEFNRGNANNRKAALRDLCELVEGETEKLILHGIRKKLIVGLDEASAQSMEWHDQINYLARRESFSNHRPLFDENLKLDFQSFRGARNLMDHKVSGKRQEMNRQIQYVERMHQGPRLLNVLLSLSRRI